MGIPGLRTHGKTRDDGPQSSVAPPPEQAKTPVKPGSFDEIAAASRRSSAATGVARPIRAR